jgi:hypothetical protein
VVVVFTGELSAKISEVVKHEITGLNDRGRNGVKVVLPVFGEVGNDLIEVHGNSL